MSICWSAAAICPRLGPLWSKLVGGKISVVEAPFADIRTKAITEHLGQSGALDVIDVSPAWIPEFADRGVIIPIDDLIKKYKVSSTLNDLHPLYRLLARQLPQPGLRFRQRQGLGQRRFQSLALAQQVLVETLHQQRRRRVVHLPQAQAHRAAACQE